MPLARYALQRVNAPGSECVAGAHGEVAHCRGDDDFARSRLIEDSRCDVDRDSFHVGPMDRALARVHSGANLEIELLAPVTDRKSAADRSTRSVEHSQNPIARGLDRTT
jgi:hypothetical protein